MNKKTNYNAKGNNTLIIELWLWSGYVHVLFPLYYEQFVRVHAPVLKLQKFEHSDNAVPVEQSC
jgi:hypothetical protein